MYTQAATLTPEVSIEQLEQLYSIRDLLALDKKAKRDQVIPAEVQQELQAIEDEYALKENLLENRISDLEADLKQRAILEGKTITGAYFNVQYTKGGYSASAKDVMRLADRWEKTNPDLASEIRSILTVKNSSASIRPRGAS